MSSHFGEIIMETVDLMFDGILKPCKLEADRGGEYLFVSEDGFFTKFPADCNLEEEIARYNEANKKKVVVIPDVVYGEVITFDENGKEIK